MYDTEWNVFECSTSHEIIPPWKNDVFFELVDLWLKDLRGDYEIIEHSWTLECLEKKTIFKQNNPIPSIISTVCLLWHSLVTKCDTVSCFQI